MTKKRKSRKHLLADAKKAADALYYRMYDRVKVPDIDMLNRLKELVDHVEYLRDSVAEDLNDCELER